MVKNLLAEQKMTVQSLGREDPLEEEMATHSSILTWEIPGTEEPGELQAMKSSRVRHDLATEYACTYGGKVQHVSQSKNTKT